MECIRVIIKRLSCFSPYISGVISRFKKPTIFLPQMNSKIQRIPLYFILFFFLLGIILKILLAFSLPVYHDVGWYISLATYHDASYMNLIVLEHPHYGYYPYLLFLALFGIKDWAVRIAPLLFSFMEILLLYIIARKWFGKTTANWVLVLSSVLYFAFINALSPEGDGSIMGFFSILLFYCFSEYYDSNCSKYSKPHQWKFLILSGIFLGIHFLIKVRTILFILPLVIYSYYKNKDCMKTAYDMVVIGTVSLIIFSIFPLQVYLSSPASFWKLLEQVLLHNTAPASLLYKITHPLIFLHIFLVLGPLSFFLCWNGLKRVTKKEKDHIVLVVIWFCSLFFMLLALLPEGLAAVYPRYFSFLLPPLLLLTARGFAILSLKNKDYFALFAGTIVISAFLLFVNQHATSYWYLDSAAMGIVKLSKALIVFFFLFSFVLLFLLALFSWKKFNIFLPLSLFLILGFSFNMLLIIDPLIDQTHQKIIHDLTAYYSNHQETGDLKKPIFLWAEDLGFYFGIKGMNINLITDPLLYDYAQRIGYNDQGYYYIRLSDPDSLNILSEQGGTVFSFYYPLEYTLAVPQGRKLEYQYLEDRCELLQSFDYPHAKAVVFEC